MTSRVLSKGLLPESASASFLEEFLTFLNEWERYAAQHGGVFLSAGTAFGLSDAEKHTVTCELCDVITKIQLFPDSQFEPRQIKEFIWNCKTIIRLQ